MKHGTKALLELGVAAALAPSLSVAQTALPSIDVGAPLRHRVAAPKPVAPPPPVHVTHTPGPVAARPHPTPRSVPRPTPAPVPAEPTPQIITASGAVHVTQAREIAETRQFNIGSALERTTPGVSVTDVAGNPFQPQINYRGFDASPISGTPQGLAVYQNGVRVNEAWGDAVNWDLIPAIAIDRTAIVTGNPLFGLNALGGAVVLDMKNGFTYQGFEIDGRFGSRARRQTAMQYGVLSGNFASYLAIEAANDGGYRKFSGSQIGRVFGDVGYRGDQGEIHATMSLAQNRFGASGPAPVDLVNIDKSAVYTMPQTYKNSLSQFGLNGVFTPAENWKLLADVHYRAFDQARVDGNTTDFNSCGDPAVLCDDQGNLTSIPDLFQGAAPLGVIDRTWVRSRTVGGTAQIENTDRILAHPNKFIFGVNYEHGWTGFSANEEMGVINPGDLVTWGSGIIVNEPQAGVTSVRLNAANSYLGVYAMDSLDVTDKLTVNAGARYNLANIALYDGIGTALNGSSKFAHVNPTAGATYKITPEVAAYASYSEANRAPTPLELGCADPNRPCLIDNFLVSDPALKQVVSHTVDAGLRGSTTIAPYLPTSAATLLPGRLEWSTGVYRTTNFDDILSVPSAVTGRGYFANVGSTQRQGVEASLRYRDERLSAYINYTLTDATFRSTTLLGSPNNPLALGLGVGNILVTPGAHLTSVAKHRLKGGFDYALTPEWKVGADVVYAAGTWVRGDEINAFGTLPSWATVNLRTSYQLTKNLQIYGLIENAGNTRARTFGTFFNTTQLPFISFSDPRQVSISAPFGIYGGVKVTF